MKNKNQVILIWMGFIIIFFAAFFFSKQNSVFLAEPTNPLILRVDLVKNNPLKKELYGFNTNQMNAAYAYLEPEFTTLTSKLKPRSLRFPGGTVANFYHWKTSGFIEDELQTSSSSTLNERNIQNYRRLVSQRSGKISFDEFMQLCEQLGVKPVIVLNLYTGSPAETASWVRYVKDKGYKIAGWELGNELYLEAYRNKFPTVEAYIEVARQHAAAIKAVDSSVQLAVVASTVGFHLNKKGTEAEFEKVWDDQLAKENFFDSYTIHMYTYSRVRQSLSFEQLRELLFGSSDVAFKQAIEYYKQVFGKRKAWITEWNIANPKNNIANTQIHAMYCGDFFLSLLNYQDQLLIANYHVLAGLGDGFSVFSPRTEKDKPSESRSVERACYPVFQLIGETLEFSEKIYSTSFKGNPSIQGFGESIDSFKSVAVGTDNQPFFIFISNRSPNSSKLGIEVNGKLISGRVRYRYIANSELAASNGGSEMVPGSRNNEITIQAWNGAANELQVPGNSFGVIELP